MIFSMHNLKLHNSFISSCPLIQLYFVFQLIIDQQDEQLELVSGSISVLRHMSGRVGEELDEQTMWVQVAKVGWWNWLDLLGSVFHVTLSSSAGTFETIHSELQKAHVSVSIDGNRRALRYILLSTSEIRLMIANLELRILFSSTIAEGPTIRNPGKSHNVSKTKAKTAILSLTIFYQNVLLVFFSLKCCISSHTQKLADQPWLIFILAVKNSSRLFFYWKYWRQISLGPYFPNVEYAFWGTVPSLRSQIVLVIKNILKIPNNRANYC